MQNHAWIMYLRLILVVRIFLNTLDVIFYDKWFLNMGHKTVLQRLMPHQRTAFLSNFYLILCLNKMAISHYQVCKPDTFESYKSLKLSFTNIQGPRSKLLVVNLSLPRINTLWGGLIERTSSILDEIASKTARIYSFFMRDRLGRLNRFRQFLSEGLFSFTWKRYCNSYSWSFSLYDGGASFWTRLMRIFICFRLALLNIMSYFFFLCRSSYSSLCSFWCISSNIDEVLSIKPSRNVFILGQLNFNRKNWLTYIMKLIDLVNFVCFSISNGLNQMVNVPLQIYDWLLQLFSSELIYLAPFHHTAFDYSCADGDCLCDHLRDVPWEDIYKLCDSAAATEFCQWNQVGIDICIPLLKYQAKSYSSTWFSPVYAAAIAHRNNFLHLQHYNKSSVSKVKFI